MSGNCGTPQRIRRLAQRGARRFGIAETLALARRLANRPLLTSLSVLQLRRRVFRYVAPVSRDRPIRFRLGSDIRVPFSRRLQRRDAAFENWGLRTRLQLLVVMLSTQFPQILSAVKWRTEVPPLACPSRVEPDAEIHALSSTFAAPCFIARHRRSVTALSTSYLNPGISQLDSVPHSSESFAEPALPDRDPADLPAAVQTI